MAVDRGKAEFRHRRHALAQPVDGARLAVGAEGPVEQWVEEGEVVRPLGPDVVA
jgi:hypothetical protein